MNQLTQEVGVMLATIPTTNGGGYHGHIGMILNKAEYIEFSSDTTPFAVLKNLGPFLISFSTNKVDCLHQMTEHKQQLIEYETYLGCYRQHVPK